MNKKVFGKIIAITTTNGTQAIEASKTASKVIIGSFLNLNTVIDFLNKEQKDVLFLCSGWKNKFNLEDTLFAGAAAQALINNFEFKTSCDSTIAAVGLYNSAKDDLFSFLENSSHRKRLSNLELDRDIKYCLTLNQCPVLPILDGKFLIKGV